MSQVQNQQTDRAVGQCGLGDQCLAPNEEICKEFICRYCGKQLHGFFTGCSQPQNANDFRDGVICTNQPCVATHPKASLLPNNATKAVQGVARSAAAGHPEFLWQTQQTQRIRGPDAPKLKRKRYTKEHKETILNVLINSPDAKINEVAKEFGTPEGTLRSWYDEDKKQKAASATSEPLKDDGDDVASATSSIEELPKKKRRQRYSNETKIQVILALETRPNNVNLREVAREFGVAAGTVRGWREEADKIQKQAMENRRVGAKANPSKDPLRRVWDAILRLFELNSRLPLTEQLDVNVAVVRTIGVQARDMLLDRYKTNPSLLSQTEYNSMQKFKASETWARKWARDHNVMSSDSRMNPVDAAQNRLTELQQIIEGFPSDHVYTMATTRLFFRILPHRTYVVTRESEKAARACKGLKSKDRMTLYICTNESGSDKLPLTCIGKYENPACFQVRAQRILPYLHQKQALSDAGTLQGWWRSTFLPHIRNRYHESEKVLLLLSNDGPCKADLLRDPAGQIRVEELPLTQTLRSDAVESANNGDKTAQFKYDSGNFSDTNGGKFTMPECQPLSLGIMETLRRRYRYRLLQEVMDAFDERILRRTIANNANFPIASRGLREGDVANLCDAMRLLASIWDEIANTTISRSWQRTRLRLKSVVPPELQPIKGKRAKSEKRQTTKERKQLVKDLSAFLITHAAGDFNKVEGSNNLEETIEKLKNCFLYSNGAVIEQKKMLDSLEEWISLEESAHLVDLMREEIKEEMNIAYLVGLQEMIEHTVPQAYEPDEPELEDWKVKKNNTKGECLEADAAMELAGTVKETAVKLFGKGNILGELAVQLDEASDDILRLLRKQQDIAKPKDPSDTKDVTRQDCTLSRQDILEGKFPQHLPTSIGPDAVPLDENEADEATIDMPTKSV